MSDFLLTLIASAYATVIGLGTAASGGTDAEATARKVDVSETRVEARTEFKRVENKANADYQSAIVHCKKEPPATKPACLEAARAVNEKTILEARATNDRLVAEARAAAMPASQLKLANKLPE